VEYADYELGGANNQVALDDLRQRGRLKTRGAKLNKTTWDKEQRNLGQKVDYAIKRGFENLQRFCKV